MAPLIGSLAYLIVEVLPEMLGGRTARKISRKVTHTIDPNRTLRKSADALQVADTIDNKINFARALREKGHLSEALQAYDQALTGIYKTDPNLLLGKAEIEYETKNYIGAKNTLDLLIKSNPDFKSPEGHLLYAKALEGASENSAAEHEYRALADYYAGPEPKCRLALLLKKKGSLQEADTLFEEILQSAKRHGRHYRSLHQDWLQIAQKECSSAGK